MEKMNDDDDDAKTCFNVRACVRASVHDFACVVLHVCVSAKAFDAYRHQTRNAFGVFEDISNQLIGLEYS